MKFLIGAMLVIGINLFAILPLITKKGEEDIENNIRYLKRHKWFKNIMQNEDYKQLIIHDNYVRKTIGKFSTKKLKNKKSNSSYQKKIENILEQRRNKTDA